MSIQLAQINPVNDTFYVWLGRTNDLVTFVNTAVSVSATSVGDMSTGNGFVTGILGANTLTATTLRGGNVSSSSTLNVVTNTALGNTTSKITTLHNGIEQTFSSNLTTSTTTAQILDSFSTTEYRSAKYLITIDNSGTNFQTTEIMMLQDGTNVYMTEYATLVSGSTLAQFNSNVSSGVARLYVTPTNITNTIKYQRILLAV